MLLSDFVEAELLEAAIHFEGVEVVKLETDQEWNFYARVRKTKPGLGVGELGALTVAQFRQATLLTNDKLACQMAENLGIPYSGGIGVLEFAVQTGRLSGKEAIQILDDISKPARVCLTISSRTSDERGFSGHRSILMRQSHASRRAENQSSGTHAPWRARYEPCQSVSRV